MPSTDILDIRAYRCFSFSLGILQCGDYREMGAVMFKRDFLAEDVNKTLTRCFMVLVAPFVAVGCVPSTGPLPIVII